MRKNRAHLKVCVCALLLLISLVASAVSTPARARSLPATGVPPFVAKLRPLLEAKMKLLHVPGAIFYVDLPGQGTWTAAMGTGDLASRVPMDVNSHMRIGSITKTLTATVILQLVDEGKLRLNDPMSRYFPEVPNGSHITIREVLDMTSGLFNYSEDADFVRAAFEHPFTVWNPRALLAIAFKHQPYFAPGQGYHYSNTNYILLGLLIEQITRLPAEKAFERRIFSPLGMDDTYLPPLSSAAIADPHPRGYLFETSNAPAPLDVTTWNPSWAWTAGSVISTLRDLEIWARALATGRLLSSATQRERLKFVPIPGGTWLGHFVGYGLGIADFGGLIGHNGDIPGFQSFMGYLPHEGATVVVLANLFQAPDGSPPADELEKVIQQQLQLF